MSTSFSTMRSSNCWILKSLRRRGVLHSGHAAEGLVNSVSTQPSHLRNVDREIRLAYWGGVGCGGGGEGWVFWISYFLAFLMLKYVEFRRSLSSYTKKNLWRSGHSFNLVNETFSTYSLWPQTFTRSLSLGFLYLVVLHLGHDCSSIVQAPLWILRSDSKEPGPASMSCLHVGTTSGHPVAAILFHHVHK